MITSLEIRWFCQGRIPIDVCTCFHQVVPGAEPEPSRVDTYLLSATADLGIKFRQGRFEIKKRVPCLAGHALSTQRFGTIEQWEKWSFPVPADDEIHQMLDAKDHWVHVTKSRFIQRYQFDPYAPLIPLPFGQIPQLGGSIEMTEVQIHDQVWWTMSLETLGPLEMQTLCMARFLAKLSAFAHQSCLMAKFACSYPQWMLNIQQARQLGKL